MHTVLTTHILLASYIVLNILLDYAQTAAMFIITEGYVCILFFLIGCSYVRYSTDGVSKDSQATTDDVQRQMSINVYFLTVKFSYFFLSRAGLWIEILALLFSWFGFNNK
jgi:hypothetical protein